MQFNLDFTDNTILSCFFFIPAAIAEIFNPNAELVIPTGTQIEEQKAEIEIHPLIIESKIRKCLI